MQPLEDQDPLAPLCTPLSDLRSTQSNNKRFCARAWGAELS